MINPFVICSVEEQAALRELADYERWSYQCNQLGATMDQIATYEATARAYARTTVYPNDRVVEYARKLAREALARGEPMPASAEAAIEAENKRQMLRLVGEQVSDETDSGLSSIISEGVIWQPPSQADSECLTCDGRGGELEHDMQGDGVWATPVTYWHACPDCIGAGKCPGCGAAMTPEQQAAAERDIESFTCSVETCGWSYDADRFQHYDEDAWGCDDWGNAYYGSADYGYW